MGSLAGQNLNDVLGVVHDQPAPPLASVSLIALGAMFANCSPTPAEPARSSTRSSAAPRHRALPRGDGSGRRAHPGRCSSRSGWCCAGGILPVDRAARPRVAGRGQVPAIGGPLGDAAASCRRTPVSSPSRTWADPPRRPWVWGHPRRHPGHRRRAALGRPGRTVGGRRTAEHLAAGGARGRAAPSFAIALATVLLPVVLMLSRRCSTSSSTTPTTPCSRSATSSVTRSSRCSSRCWWRC